MRGKRRQYGAANTCNKEAITLTHNSINLREQWHRKKDEQLKTYSEYTIATHPNEQPRTT